MFGAVAMHSRIRCRLRSVGHDGETVQIVETTPGRMQLARLLPRHPELSFELINRVLTKREISEVIDTVYRHCGQKETVLFCDRIMDLGLSSRLQRGAVLRQGRHGHSGRQGRTGGPHP